MFVIDFVICRGVPLRDDALDLLVLLELLGLAFLLEMDRLEVLPAEKRILQPLVQGDKDALDVVVDPLQAAEALQVLVRLPRIVNVAVILPLDEEEYIPFRFVLLVVF